MVTITVDSSVLRTLCLQTERYRRSSQKGLFSWQSITKVRLSGTLIVADVITQEHEITPVAISSRVVNFRQKCYEKFLSKKCTRIGSYMISFVMFIDEQLNKAIEIVYGLYMLYRKKCTLRFVYKRIIEHENCDDVVKAVARKFLSAV